MHSVVLNKESLPATVQRILADAPDLKCWNPMLTSGIHSPSDLAASIL